ncbi:MAG TPA: hypothetical protein VK005_00765, partial [Acholeplasma sp.]|nr:hypothetical protein [Acholeplasma sp.]
MQTYLSIYQSMRARLKAYGYAMWVLSWDLETEAPVGSLEYRGQQIEMLTNEIYALETDKEYLKSIDYLYQNREQLDELMRREIE